MEEELELLFGSDDNSESETDNKEDTDSIDTLNDIEKEIEDLNAMEDNIEQDALDDVINEIAADEDEEENNV